MIYIHTYIHTHIWQGCVEKFLTQLECNNTAVIYVKNINMLPQNDFIKKPALLLISYIKEGIQGFCSQYYVLFFVL